MLKLKMTGKNFSPGILKLPHIRFVENGFKLWYNYVNVNSIFGYEGNRYYIEIIEEQAFSQADEKAPIFTVRVRKPNNQ